MPDRDDYLQHAYPVLVTYTQQVALAVDIARLQRLAAADPSDSPRRQFLEAMATFIGTVRKIEIPGVD